MSELNKNQRVNLTIVDIWNCANAFEFLCPRYWDSLDRTEDEEVRFCRVCEQKVYRCTNPLDFVSHGELGHCVAIPEEMTPVTAHMELIGRPSPRDKREHEEQKIAVRHWWKDVLEIQPQFAPEAIQEVRQYFRFK